MINCPRLAEHVLRHGQRVSVQVEVADVPDQESKELVALVGGPALPRAGFADRTLHHLAACGATAGNGAPKALRPGVVEAQQFHELDQLLS